MGGQEWKIIYGTMVRMNRTLAYDHRQCQYTDILIVAMYVWSVLHDRPRCWAAQRENYYGPFRPRKLPSRSQFERRLKSPRCTALLQATWTALGESNDGPTIHFLDGRALPVGPYSQDRDARRGYVAGQFAKGYKLHALTKNDGKTAAWRVAPLNVCEKTVARELIAEAQPRGLVLADGNYDAGWLYDHVLTHGALLFTPLPRHTGGGHRPQSDARLLAGRLWKRGGADLYRLRTTIERQFSRQSCFGGGLGPLPAWVRGLPRVTRWVGTKLMIYHVRLKILEAAA